ncbi:MAG: thioredoxin-dependent thiol peroxidase [Bacteroidetes bacterium]|nr:thioredoxin-dependent thiol peroxidase [Bacteroidota bacterium]
MLKIGMKAPQFSLMNQNGGKISLNNLLGKKVVLYFYPKDMTSGCTKESCDFRDNFEKFEDADCVIIGVSADSIKSHKKFEEKYYLPFTLLSDEKKTVLEKYGVWKEKSMYGRKYFGIERTTFVIDEKGKIQNIYPKVKVTNHIKEILKDLDN